MKVLVAGGRGFIGTALASRLRSVGHEVWILTRRPATHRGDIHWDGRSADGWSNILNDIDAVVNATGYGLEHWPWSSSHKRRFAESRIVPGRALSSAISNCSRRPQVFVQISGVNYYGLRGSPVADESTPPADDFLGQLTVSWEAATRSLDDAGIRRVVARSAIVLDAHAGLFPLMVLPVRLFLGGRLGGGKQAVPWIHVADQVGALQFLLENAQARGVFNLVAPTATSNEQFMRAIARTLHRPFWFPAPAFLLRAALGEMSGFVLEGRQIQPARLLQLGYRFEFAAIETAVQNLFGRQ